MKECRCVKCKKLLFKYSPVMCAGVGYLALECGKGKYIEQDGVGIVQAVCGRCHTINVLEAFEIKGTMWKGKKIDVLMTT